MRRRAVSPVSLVHRIRVDAHAAWLAARDPRTPWIARAIGLAIAAYALSPIDLIPDFIPVLGLIDEAVLIPAGLWLLMRLIPDTVFAEHRITAAAAAERPSSIAGALLVISLWTLATILAWRLLAPWFD